jgi:hypothetical protein
VLFSLTCKQRFGETLPEVDNMLRITPFETTQRHLRKVSDYASYKRIHSTLPAAVLAALKTRVRAGETKAVRELWEKKDKTFLAIDFEWSERNQSSCLEWGYAAVRCGYLSAWVAPAIPRPFGVDVFFAMFRLGHWPPLPDANYRSVVRLGLVFIIVIKNVVTEKATISSPNMSTKW